MASYRAAQVPAWVGEKLQSAIGKNLTLPSCADIPLPHLLALDSPGAADVLPSFLDSLHAGPAPPTSTATTDARRVHRCPAACGLRLVQRCPREPFWMVLSAASHALLRSQR